MMDKQRETFEKWCTAHIEGAYSGSSRVIKSVMFKIWQARQPEIDTLKTENECMAMSCAAAAEHMRDLQARIAQREWQPIETAPNNGRFLVYVPIKNHRNVIAMRGTFGIILDEAAQPIKFPATHWMTLPKDPG